MAYDRDFFEDVYAEGDGDSWGYFESDYERRKAERPLAALRDRRPPGTVERIVDLGCGNGAKTAHLVEAYPDAEVVGVDLSAEALAVAREEVPGATFEQADMVEWVEDAAAEGSVDAVYAVGALHYLCAQESVTDLLAVADDLREALAPDGLLVAAHNHMPRGGGPTFVQERSVATLRTVLETAFETVGRARYDAEKTTALDPDEPASQPYEVWAMEPSER
ncbi:MAG: trans-aconitate 2-methyltransferase [Haloglomus sp.]